MFLRRAVGRAAIDAEETISDESISQAQETPGIKDVAGETHDVSGTVTPAKPVTITIKQPQNAPRRGGIALALGGGAAKGWAHIGVLRAFDEADIPITMIAGTSIGALVGGCYLSGKLDELEEFARSLTWSGVLRYMDFSLRGSGLISGSRLANRMTKHLSDVRIEGLTRQFVSICTDIRTGHEIWLHDGPLSDAIRASYALPGVFAPVVLNGRHLVDGAIVNPVPVSACRAYEPEVVIAIDLNSEAFGRGTVIRASHYETNCEESASADMPHAANASYWQSFFNSTGHKPAPSTDLAAGPRTLHRPQIRPKNQLGTMGVMMEAFNIIQDRIARARLAGDPPDFLIRPKLNNVGLADFHKAATSIDIGYREAKMRIVELSDEGEIASA